jgi:protein-S-isoprenylcysteine O-methyltransferase Ste14
VRHGVTDGHAAGRMTAAATRLAQALGLWILIGGPVLAGCPPAPGFPQIWLIVGLSVLANVLQPRYRLGDPRPREDHGTFLQIMVTVYLTQLAALVELVVRCPRTLPFRAVSWIALGAMVGGLALRTWAIATLGRYFTLPVMVRAAQPVVERGPYRLLRHPSYLGALVMFVGSCVLLESYVAAAAAAVALTLAFRRRIRHEEQLLRGALPGYRAYATRTDALLPRMSGLRARVRGAP